MKKQVCSCQEHDGVVPGTSGASDGLCKDEPFVFSCAEHEDRDARATGRLGLGCREEALAVMGTAVVSASSLPLGAVRGAGCSRRRLPRVWAARCLRGAGPRPAGSTRLQITGSSVSIASPPCESLPNAGFQFVSAVMH